MGLREQLIKRLTVADGAMGTLLYDQGFDLCFEELNLSDPEKVKVVHQSYLDAGATLIQTNTYAANAVKLKKIWLREVC